MKIVAAVLRFLLISAILLSSLPLAPTALWAQSTVSPPIFSVAHGFFNAPFQLTLSSNTAGATIRYTTDYTTPTPATGTIYAGPIQINGTTVVRAIAYTSSSNQSATVTQSYLFPAQVKNQSNSPPAGWPSTFAACNSDACPYPAYYELAPDIVTQYPSSIENALRGLPAISLVTDLPNLWNTTTGIYYNPNEKGAAWERPVSIEWISPNGGAGFTENAGVRLHGQATRRPHRTPKKTFRLYFNATYGSTKLNFQLFSDPNAVNRFDRILLRGGGNRSWPYFDRDQRREADYINDEFARRAFLEMGGLAGHGTFAHLYVDGLYWGLYNVTERMDGRFLTAYRGGVETDYDMIAPDEENNYAPTPDPGDLVAWNNLHALLNATPISDATYNQVKPLLNLTDLADYMILLHYIANTDWPAHNWFTYRKRVGPDTRFHMIPWDADTALNRLSENMTTADVADTPARLFHRLMSNAEFRQLVADRFWLHMESPNGVLTPAKCATRYGTLANFIDPAIISESARWGAYAEKTYPQINFSATNKALPAYLYSRDLPPANTDPNNDTASSDRKTWISVRDAKLNTYCPQRTGVVIGQYITNNWYQTSLKPPAFSQEGGTVPTNTNLTISNPNGSTGDIFYTTDGSDPRQVGGNPAASAINGTDLATVALNQTLTIKARLRNGTTWSPLHEGRYLVSGPGNQLPVVAITAPANNATFASGGTVIIAANASDPDGAITQVLFQDNGVAIPGCIDTTSAYECSWTPTVGMHTLTAIATDNVAATATSTTITVTVTQGGDCSTPPPALLINEIMYSPLVTLNSDDWVEIYNPTAAPVNLANWILQDSAADFILPTGATIAGNGYLAVIKNQALFTNTYPSVSNYVGNFPFGLSSAGEAVRLLSPTRCLVDEVIYGVAAPWPPAPVGTGPSLSLLATNLDNSQAANWTASSNNGGTPSTANTGATPNLSPLVAIISPTNGLNFLQGSALTIQANASDPDGTIAQVVFRANNVAIPGCTDTSAPYSCIITPTVGNHQLSAIATDNRNASTASAPVNITIAANNQAPTVNILSPVNGDSFAQGASVTIRANAADLDGTISQVLFQDNGVAIPGCNDNSTPYECTFTPAVGNHALSAIATDNSNLSTTSLLVNIGVTGSGDSGAFIEQAGQVVMEAEHFSRKFARSGHDWLEQTTQAGAVGTSMIALPNTGLKLDSNIATASPELLFDVRFAQTGSYALWARVYGPSGSDDSIYLGVNGVVGPALSLGTGSWQWRKASSNFAITTAGLQRVHVWMREDGSVIDRLLLTTANSTPSGNGPAESLRAGGTGNQSPSVNISSPTNGASLATGAAINIQANASDPDGNVMQVIFAANGNQFCVDSSAPFQCSWSPSAGNYVLTAIASDNLGATSTSAPVNVTITNGGGGGSGAFIEQNGQVVMEAENFQRKIDRSNHTWQASTAQSGYAGAAAVAANPNSGANLKTSVATTSPELQYQVQFSTPGTYQIWLRTWAANGADNSVHIGIDGQLKAEYSTAYGSSLWTWSRKSVAVPTAGLHTISLWMREDGLFLDRLVLTTDSAFTPNGIGPAESGRAALAVGAASMELLAEESSTPELSATLVESAEMDRYVVLPLTVSLMQPENGAILAADTPLTLAAFTEISDESDDAGELDAQVLYYANGQVIEECDVTSLPHRCTWLAEAGSYQLTAISFSDNSTVTSEPVQITVNEAGEVQLQQHVWLPLIIR